MVSWRLPAEIIPNRRSMSTSASTLESVEPGAWLSNPLDDPQMPSANPLPSQNLPQGEELHRMP